MRFFSRHAREPESQLLTASPADLKRLGEMAFGGQNVYPPGMGGIPTAELDAYAMAFLAAAGYPASGSAAEAEATDRFLNELSAVAGMAGDWGYVGAMCVGWNCLASAHHGDPRYLGILDRSLETLRTDGVSFTAVPPFALDRWTSVHGYGESRPTGWPSALAYLPVPSAEEAPPVEDLVDGESRRLAQAAANTIYAERRPDGSIRAVVEGSDPELGEVRRWDWEGLSAADYLSLLRELGDRLVTQSAWAHDDLLPYFPCRQRSRDQMRIEASAHLL